MKITFRTTMEISVFTFLFYPGILMCLFILVLLYVFTLVYKMKKKSYYNAWFKQ